MALRIAFTGTGHMACTHAQAAQCLPDVELVAVVNHRPESRAAYAERFGIARQYDSVEALLADGAVDCAGRQHAQRSACVGRASPRWKPGCTSWWRNR